MHVYPEQRRVRPLERMDETAPRSRRRNDSRNTFRTILTLAILIAVLFGILMIVYIVRQNSTCQTNVVEGNSQEENNEHEKTIFDNCIDFLLENLLQLKFNQSNLQPIRIKVLITLRHLSPAYKRDLILFLYERGLIRTDIPIEQRLALHGADLKNIEFKNINLDYLYLPGVIATDSLFSHCQLKHSNFEGSIMDRSRFIACSLDQLIFSGASLKNTSVLETNILPNIDFTNADLSGSYINITGLNNKNVTFNTRFPDGSFLNIDSKELVKDGGAEQLCNKTQNATSWWPEDGYQPFQIAHKSMNSCIKAANSTGNQCYFHANSSSRFNQYIDLHRYSTLIDNHRALFNISAHIGCNSSNDSAIVELRFANERKNYEYNSKDVLTSGGASLELKRHSSVIPTGTRTVRIIIGANIRSSSVCCAIDDVKFNIFANNKNNATYL